LWNQKVHSCVYKSLPFYLILSRLNPADIFTICFIWRSTFIFSDLSLGFQALSCLDISSPKFCMHFSFHPCRLHVLFISHCPLHNLCNDIRWRTQTEEWICQVQGWDQYWVNALMYLWVPYNKYLLTR